MGNIECATRKASKSSGMTSFAKHISPPVYHARHPSACLGGKRKQHQCKRGENVCSLLSGSEDVSECEEEEEAPRRKTNRAKHVPKTTAIDVETEAQPTRQTRNSNAKKHEQPAPMVTGAHALQKGVI